MPLPRTCHMVTNSVVTPTEDAAVVKVASSWSCHVFRLKDRGQHCFFGRYEHLLSNTDGQWRIASKTVVLMNDTVPTMLDFYCI
jgi:3-phenylpropionate/cinnamic acid dioxygenase small subunit